MLTPDKVGCDDDPWVIDLGNFISERTLWHRAMFKVAPATAAFRAAEQPIKSAIQELVERRAIDLLEMEESFGWSYSISRLHLLPIVVTGAAQDHGF